MSKSQGTTLTLELSIDVGFSPLSGTMVILFGQLGALIDYLIKLPSGETLTLQGLEVFRNVIYFSIMEFIIEGTTLMATYAVGKAAYETAQPEIAAVALSVEFVEELTLTNLCWDNRSGLLTFGIVNIILGLIAVKVNLAVVFLQALFNIVSVPTTSALYLLVNSAITAAGIIQEAKRDLFDWFEIGLTFTFAAVALGRYMEMSSG